MSTQKVREYLKQFNLDDKMLEFSQSSATVELAAQRLNVIPARIAKTLSFKQGDKVVLIVAAGDAKIDNHKYKELFHQKASMLPFDEVEEKTGHPVGGVCPFAVNENVSVYLDNSLKRFDTIFPAVGSAASAIELTCDQLYTASKAISWIDVCKLPEENA